MKERWGGGGNVADAIYKNKKNKTTLTCLTHKVCGASVLIHARLTKKVF